MTHNFLSWPYHIVLSSGPYSFASSASQPGATSCCYPTRRLGASLHDWPEHKIDIICIQEHRYTHTEDIKYHETGNGWSLVTVSAWKNSVNATVGGVGLLIGSRALKMLNSVEKIQPRMMAATFNGNPRATIISCYSPTNVSEETELVTFYDELSSLVRSIPKHSTLVIGGDMNAQIGKNGNNKYSLHNTSNKNGQHLTDFMIENRLACLNTNYQKREGKL